MRKPIWRCRWSATVVVFLLACNASHIQSAPSTWGGTRALPLDGEEVSNCVTGDALLDSPVMRDLMHLLWDHSFADAAPEERRERGGFLFDSLGVLVYRADLDHPRDTPCASFVIVPRCGTPIAAVFTHPFRPGEYLPASCHPGQPGDCRYTTERFGRASALDLAALRDWLLPGYILDKQYVYAIPRGSTEENALSQIRRYPRFDHTVHCRLI